MRLFRAGPGPVGCVSGTRRGRGVGTGRKGAVRTHEKAAICKPRRSIGLGKATLLTS